jgi:hypothetical protein
VRNARCSMPTSGPAEAPSTSDSGALDVGAAALANGSHHLDCRSATPESVTGRTPRFKTPGSSRRSTTLKQNPQVPPRLPPVFQDRRRRGHGGEPAFSHRHVLTMLPYRNSVSRLSSRIVLPVALNVFLNAQAALWPRARSPQAHYVSVDTSVCACDEGVCARGVAAVFATVAGWPGNAPGSRAPYPPSVTCQTRQPICSGK